MAIARAANFGGLLEAARLQGIQTQLVRDKRIQDFARRMQLAQQVNQTIAQIKAERKQKSAESKQRKKARLGTGLAVGGAALGGVAGLGGLGAAGGSSIFTAGLGGAGSAGLLGGGLPGAIAGAGLGAQAGGGFANLINTGDASGFANAFGAGSQLIQDNRFLELVKQLQRQQKSEEAATSNGGQNSLDIAQALEALQFSNNLNLRGGRF